jgi:hypothetical protein
MLSNGFTPTSVVTLHPINKQQWHEQYVKDVARKNELMAEDDIIPEI